MRALRPLDALVRADTGGRMRRGGMQEIAWREAWDGGGGGGEP